jgi:hypothetical protein
VAGPKRARYSITLNVTTPYLRLMNDGKTPYLGDFPAIVPTIKEAAAKAYRAMVKPTGTMSIKDAAYQVMERAYWKASDNGELPAKARQIMYAARGDILRLTGREKLDDRYFTQTLLPDFMNDYPDVTNTWDVVWDARGHFTEPHTGRSVPLGTLPVREYLGERPKRGPALQLNGSDLYPTAGPDNRYRNVLFVEKEGFDELWQAVQPSGALRPRDHVDQRHVGDGGAHAARPADGAGRRAHLRAP